MRLLLSPEIRNFPRILGLVTLATGMALQSCSEGEAPTQASAQNASSQSSSASAPAQQATTKKSKPRGNVEGLQKAQILQSNSDSGAVGPVQTVPVQTQVAELPPLQMQPPILDFGFIPPNTEVRGSVKLTNVSEDPMNVLAVQPTCKCTTLNDLAGSVIPPGGSIDLEAAMDGGPNPGPKTAAVKVLIEGYARPIEVDLKAEISLAIRAIPPYINAVSNKNQTGRIVIESITGKPFRICSIHGMKPTLLNFDPETDPPRSKYIFTYDIENMPVPYPRYLAVVTDDPDVPVVDIYFRHETTMPSISKTMRVAKGYRHPFGRIDMGGSKNIEIGFQEMRERVATVISGTPNARVELIGSKPVTEGDKINTYYEIKIIPAKDFEGVLYFPVTFMTSSGDSIDVPVFGVVVPKDQGCPASVQANDQAASNSKG